MGTNISSLEIPYHEVIVSQVEIEDTKIQVEFFIIKYGTIK